MKNLRKRLSFANVTSMLALFVALGGTTAWAVATIGADDIKRNAVRASHIKAGNVKRADIAANAVNGPRLANGSVASPDLADGTVSSSDLADGSVASADLADSSVAGADLADSSVASPEIADGAVSAGDLGVTPQWTDISLAAGWITFDGSTDSGPAQCYMDPFGIVHLRGAVERAGGNNTVGTLPPSCRVFPVGSPLYAPFPVVKLDSVGDHNGTDSMWIGAGNFLGFDTQPFPPDGEGFSLEGVAIGAR